MAAAGGACSASTWAWQVAEYRSTDFSKLIVTNSQHSFPEREWKEAQAV